jgi:hypothetical protein
VELDTKLHLVDESDSLGPDSAGGTKASVKSRKASLVAGSGSSKAKGKTSSNGGSSSSSSGSGKRRRSASTSSWARSAARLQALSINPQPSEALEL